MIPPMVTTAAALASPEIAPLHDAVAACDRDAVATLVRAEAHRRADFAEAAYVERRAIAADRAAFAPAPATVGAVPAATVAAGRAAQETARAALDARLARLDDAKAVELAWRTALDDMRADFLANCDSRKRN